MIDALFFFAQYQNWLYLLLGLGLGMYVVVGWRARVRWHKTPYGLEKEAAWLRLKAALAALLMLAALVIFVYVNDQVIVPNVNLRNATPLPTLPPPTATPVRGRPVMVDSSGCGNPNATLLAPQTGEALAGAYVVQGTARAEAFAFYTLEISGENTGGEWVPVVVGSVPVTEGELGNFDTSGYLPGEYALRLVVRDTTDHYPPPCVIVITILPSSPMED